MHIKAYIKSEILPCLIIWHRLIWFTNLRKKSLSRTNQGCTGIYPGMCPYGTQPGLNNCMYKKVKKKTRCLSIWHRLIWFTKGKNRYPGPIEGVSPSLCSIHSLAFVLRVYETQPRLNPRAPLIGTAWLILPNAITGH